MKRALGKVLALASALLMAACSSDSNDPESPANAAGAGGDGTLATGGNGGETGALPGDTCHAGCMATLAADCSRGPADQAGCEADCHELEAGKCGREYVSLQNCSEGQAISCGARGLPTVSACSDEQAAVVACLNG